MSHRIYPLLIALCLVLASLVACAAPAPATSPTTPPKPADPDLVLATTTSTQDSGLLDVLVPLFEKQTGYKVKTVAVGSGAAMTMGERGEADVLLVHSPSAEVTFVQKEFGIDRRLIMHNDFIIVGPASDPAGIKGTKVAADALKKIAEKKALFIGRGDKSGTDTAEQGLWKATGITTTGQSWYQQTGQGMGATLNVAAEKGGYTLADRATQLATEKTTKLAILVEGDKAMFNIYHVIRVNPAKWPRVNSDGALAFANFMTNKDTQDTISKVGIEKYGKPLFYPDAGMPEY